MNIWIEKTRVYNRPDRERGERALGKALWSPTRAIGGADFYKNMRAVKKGDLVLHLINNKEFAGISIVKKEAVETEGVKGTDWEGPAYLIELEGFQKLNPSLSRDNILKRKNKKTLDRIASESEVFFTRTLELRQGAYLTPCSVALLSLINQEYFTASNSRIPYIERINFEETLETIDNGGEMNNKNMEYFLAIKTKPFIILAGLSGTGKSRLARSLAYQFDNIEEDRSNKIHPPSNFQLIKVKPNWHDSSDLLGYESRISGKDRFIVTDFVRFIVKAWQYPHTPFFLCLDEMNLAPVEQYFAEYLSAIETRQLKVGAIQTDAIISKSILSKYGNKADGVDQTFDLWGSDELNVKEEKLRADFISKGLTLPPNLIIMGTVNMDETTHSFSRKVLDRAMTIEMNDFDLSKGLDDKADEWRYPDNPISAEHVISERTHGSQVYGDLGGAAVEIIEFLELINAILEETPFKIAYRVRDEFLLFAYNYTLLENKPETWLSEVFDQMTLMKILPRIEGDEEKTKVLSGLISFFETQGLLNSSKKAKEMETRRKLYHYTSFWA
jgi:hypothetical protein